MDNDNWGKDPQVRYLRKVFAHIEKSQKELLGKINIPDYDERLRRWRDGALNLFERSWALSARWGVYLNEQEASAVYLHCLAYVLMRNRIEVPKELLPDNEKIDMFIKGIAS